MQRALVVGLFVGGRAARFGGIAKGNLQLPSGVSLVERLTGVCRQALPEAELVLVGRAAAYEKLGLEAIADRPAGIGPLGGLRALVARAAELRAHAAVALACDMPYLSAELLRRIANEAPRALALAPCIRDLWQPLCGRYAVATLPVLDDAVAAGEHSLQGIFRRLGAAAQALPLAVTELHELTDWDCPEDMPA